MNTTILISNFADAFPEALVKELHRWIKGQAVFVFIASDFSDHEGSLHYQKQWVQKFCDASIIPKHINLIDACVTKEEAQQLARHADVVFLMGGNTLKQMASIKAFGLCDAIRSRTKLTIGMSAGAINLGTHVVLARDAQDHIPDLCRYEGIGKSAINIEPHANHMSEQHRKDVSAAAQLGTIYGLHDESFIVISKAGIRIHGSCDLFLPNSNNSALQ